MKRPILFVDDSAVVRAATTRRLAGRGLPVTALGSSREAHEVDPTSFSAALLDIELGDGFGPDVAARLRLASPALPIAFLSGYDAGHDGGHDGGHGSPSNLLDAARAIGPVFSKGTGVEDAILWLLSAIGI